MLMPSYLFANNAKSTLAAPINTTATSLTLQSGTGALFPNPSGGDFFALVLTDAATGNVFEILKCTARTGDVCTVARAQEGTIALNWTTGDFANNVLTKETAEAMQAGGGGGDGPAAEIAAVAKTLRKTINAYRVEPNSDNRTLAYTVLTAAKQTNTDAGISVWEPDGGLSYGAAWTRDQAMMMEGYLDYFAPAEIGAIATYWLSKCNLLTGEVPDHILLNGTVVFKPGPSGTWGSRAPIDGNFFLLQFFWLHYVMTGSASLYSANSTDLLALIETGVSYNGSTNCVNISDSTPYVGWGFMDTAILSGDVLYCSILAVRAFQMAAEMEFSLGNSANASALLERANLIKSGINSTLVVRAAGSGAYLAAPYNAREIAWGELATTKGANQVDLWGTAMLAWCEIVSPTDAKAIGNFLNYTVNANTDNYVRGGLRNITKATDYTANTECYQATWDTAPTYGTYQNGGFWPTPGLALQGALELVQPESARQVALDLYSYSREQGSPFLEWWNSTGGTVGVTRYCTSTTVLMGASDGPALFVDEWSGLDRSVANETLTLVMNASFAGTILATSTKCASGTATVTFEINSTALGGAANAASSTEQTVARTSANRFNAGDDIKMVISANASCVDLYFSIKFIRRV